MTPAEVAKYVKAFQKAARTRKVKSRLIRRDVNYHDNIAELIRPVLSRSLYRMVRRRRGYELVWQGTSEGFQRLLPRLPQTATHLRTAGIGHGFGRDWLTPPYDALLDEAVDALPILNRFRQDEARLEVDPDAMPTEPADNLAEPIEEDEEPPIPVEVTPAIPPEVVAENIAAAMRAREEGVPTNVEFRTEGERRFAEALARATRRG
jgi:hypothetical protein